ncbi:MFS transporter [Propionibacteriaceae bacterium G1746]|uniref:MFS transporter n=1 Tax=Aestuariimicrobium sp. G57 TaxID=3418485 RepID=UPI003C1EF721
MDETGAGHAAGQAARWAGHRPGSTGYRRLMAALFLAGVAAFSQLYSPQGLLPLIAAERGMSPDEASLVVSMGTLGLTVGVLPWSYAGDRWGRRQCMGVALVAACVFGLGVFMVSAVLGDASTAWPLMLGLRFAEGFALGGIPALALAYLTEEVHVMAAPIAAGSYISGNTIGGLSGRIIAAPVGEQFGWHIGQLAVVVVATLCAIAFVVVAPPAKRFTPRTTTWRRGVTDVVDNVKSPRLVVLYAQAFLLMGGFVAMYNYLGFHLSGPPFNLPLWLTALVFLAYLAGTWTSPQAGRLAARKGRRPVLLASVVVMLVGVLATLVASLPVLLVATLVFTGGFFAAHAVASGWSSAAATGGRAQSAALYTLSYYAGSSLFGWLGGGFLTRWGWPGTVLMTASLVACALVLALVGLPRESRGSRDG